MSDTLPVILGDWVDKEDLLNDFGIEEKDLRGMKLLLGWRDPDIPSYSSGRAFVLLSKAGALHWVDGYVSAPDASLEGDWHTQKVKASELWSQIEEDDDSIYSFAEELAFVLVAEGFAKPEGEKDPLRLEIKKKIRSWRNSLDDMEAQNHHTEAHIYSKLADEMEGLLEKCPRYSS